MKLHLQFVAEIIWKGRCLASFPQIVFLFFVNPQNHRTRLQEQLHSALYPLQMRLETVESLNSEWVLGNIRWIRWI